MPSVFFSDIEFINKQPNRNGKERKEQESQSDFQEGWRLLPVADHEAAWTRG